MKSQGITNATTILPEGVINVPSNAFWDSD